MFFKEIRPAVQEGGLGEPVVGPAIGLFGLTVAFYDVGGLLLLIRKVVKARRQEKSQRLYLLLGLGMMLVTIIVLNFIFPTALKNTKFIPYASVLMLPFVLFTSYAIIKHKLLDIKAVVARSLVYVFLLISLAAVFAASIFGASAIILQEQRPNSVQSITFIVLAIIIAFIFQPLRRFF